MSEPRMAWLAAAAGAIMGLVVLLFQPPVWILVGALLAAIGGMMVIANPFLGVLILVALLQQEAWTKLPIRLNKSTTLTFADLMVVLVFSGIMVRRLRRSRAEPLLPEDRILRLGVLFVAVATLAFLHNHPMLRKGLVETQKYLGFVVLLMLIVHLTRTKRQVRWLVMAIVFSTTISSGALLLDRYAGAGLGKSSRAVRAARFGPYGGEGSGKESRLTGSGGTAENSGKMMVVGTTISAMTFLLLPMWRPFTGITAVLGLLALPATGTRMAMVVLFPAILWIFYKFRRHRRLGVALGVLPLALIVALAVVPQSTIQRLVSLKDPTTDSTTPWRMSMYTIGLQMLRDNPLLGIGPAQFENSWVGFDYRWDEGQTPQPMHDAYLGVALDTGVVGGALFLAMLVGAWTSLHWARRHAEDAELRALAEAVEVAYVIYLLTAATGPGHRQLYLWSLIGTALAIGKVARRTTRAARSQQDPNRGEVVTIPPQSSGSPPPRPQVAGAISSATLSP